MNEQKNETQKDLCNEIEKQRLKFRLDAEKVLFDRMKAAVGRDKVTADKDCKETPAGQNEQAGPSDKAKKTPRKHHTLKTIGVMAPLGLGYAGLLIYVLNKFCSGQLGNNVCVVIVTVLMLATLAVILAGKYTLALRQLSNEEAKADAQKDNKKNGPKESFDDQVQKRIQEAVLNIIVKDTIDTFNKQS